MTLIVNLNKMPYDVYIGRKNSPHHFGNPFTHVAKYGSRLIVKPDRQAAVEAYRQWLTGESYEFVEIERRQWILDNLHTLKDKKLGCFCKPLECHGDVLLDLINKL